MKSVRFAVMIASAIALLAACSKPQPIETGTDTSFYGQIVAGEKFGIKIGDTREAARTAMQKEQFEFSGEGTCRDTGLDGEISCAPQDNFDFFHKHKMLGHDTVFVGIRDGRVASIGWSFVLVEVDS